jgi:acyl dehydratase
MFCQRIPVALRCTTAVSAVATTGSAAARGIGLAKSRAGAYAHNLRLALEHNGSNNNNYNTCTFHSTQTDSWSTNENDKDVGGGGGGGISSVVPIIRGTLPRHSVEKHLAVGQYAETDRCYSHRDVTDFARLVRDGNPLHSSWEPSSGTLTSDLPPSVLEGHDLLFHRKMDADGSSMEKDDTTTTTTRAVVVHGMLVACLFTSIFGTLYPGAVYTQQSLDFKRPVYIDTVVVGRVTVQRMRSWKNGVLVTCDTTVTTPQDGTVVVRGKATVWLPRGCQE